jgi:probable F420-dependent oxidoreductase
MRLGSIFPHDAAATPGDIRTFAEHLEAVGYDFVTSFDHVLGADPKGHAGFAGPFTHEARFHEILTLLAFVTAVAPSLELATSIIVLPQRQTALVAKQAAELDVLSNGKMRLGVAIGWNAIDYQGLGIDFASRVPRLEEQVELMRRLWTEPSITFEGKFDTVISAGINPLPVQRPIPIYLGGLSPVVVERAARIADGFVYGGPIGESWAQTIDSLHGALRAVGREPASFGIEARIDVSDGTTPEAWQEEAAELGRLGVDHLAIDSAGVGVEPKPLDFHLSRLSDAADVVREAVGTTASAQ